MNNPDSLIPAWNKPPVTIPVRDLREFVAKYGPDVAVMVTWSHENNECGIYTIGNTRQNADLAVSIGKRIADSIGIDIRSPDVDLRHEHPETPTVCPKPNIT